ncbi:c-type cytochrome [Maritimibacter dapengensis]|uniref:C-type cytochrome n=1 Tax=Maritimibacter dapengensis TaxID=2836868 RepID=A0ABS6SYE9_9RHOB|nr:c-type cytochrome [Maritimibacter dapengensis]MBV7377994.1 c-type cytochrome [Maritimibacter dapengensis]
MTWRGFLRGPLDGRTVARLVAGVAVVGALTAGAVVGFGLYNVSAKAGHWPGVSWVLHSTFRNAVALRAHAEPPADLDSADMIALGARHFDSACRFCHAAPGEERSATVRAMVPAPPPIAEAVTHWEADELHWIVHNGIKMSGMPAWPAERDDDVWPVVAFLRAVPEMNGTDYARLTRKPDDNACLMCHGTDGATDNAHIPRLDILSETYIATSLHAYAIGSRDSGIMAEAVSDLTDADIDVLAAALSAVSPQGQPGSRDALAQEGQTLATARGTVDVPACRACHGPWPEPLNTAFPSLAGQHAPYLEAQLKLWRDGNRGGGTASRLMHQAARDLTDEQITRLAAYYASLAPAKLNDTSN